MKRSRMDSRIEVWSVSYINNPMTRSPEDRDAKIEQIEYTCDTSFIVEVFNPEVNDEDD